LSIYLFAKYTAVCRDVHVWWNCDGEAVVSPSYKMASDCVLFVHWKWRWNKWTCL